MSLDSSSTLCPSESCAFTSYSGRSKSSTIATSRSFKQTYQGSSTLVKPDTVSPRVRYFQNECSTSPASPFEPLFLNRNGTTYQHKTNDHLSKKGGSHRNAAHEEGEEQSCTPPVSEVRIPLAAVVQQGLIELSKEDWKSLYLFTHQNLEDAVRHTCAAHEENRLLKRRLIEMQKTLFETRRNKRQSPDHEFPWTIPDYSQPNAPTPVNSSTEDEESTGKRHSKVLRQDSETSTSAS